MKYSSVLIFFMIYHSCFVESFAIFDAFSDGFTYIKSSVVNAFRSMRYKIKHLFFPEANIEIEMYNTVTDFQKNPRTKKAFSDFVDQMAAESETELPEYINFKTEPTALMSTPQLATLHGKRIESHVVLTKDGYLLSLHRLISPVVKKEGGNSFLNETVLLHHGILGSSADWILLGPSNSLPYFLSNMGYDVWMTNARGNYYSRGHTTKKVDEVDFWKFSWHEMGYYDLPAVVDYMNTVKNTNSSINFIGHSMGTTSFLVMLSMLPEYNKYFKMGILLAPLAFLSNAEGPLRLFTSIAKHPPDQLLKILGNGEFMPNRKVPSWISDKYCKNVKIFCSNPLLFITGGAPDNEVVWESSFTARVLYHAPAGGSTSTILHYAQLIKSGKFHKYGDDSDEYELGKVTVPIAFITSSDDWLSTVPDVLRLYFSVLNPIDHHVFRGKKIAHTDFVWGVSAKDLVFDKVFDYLVNGLNYNSSKTNEI